MNGASIVILIIVSICLVFALKKVINDKNNGCSGCGGCSGCSNTRCSSYRNIEIVNRAKADKEK